MNAQISFIDPISSIAPASGIFSMSSNTRVQAIILNGTDGKQEGQFSLIHIPLSLYSSLLQPILQVLLLHNGSSGSSDIADRLEGLSIDNKHGFLNISVTPIECSIVCHTSWARRVFAPMISHLPSSSASQVQISKESYIVFSVSSAGMEAGQRVMDLTAPLAMAGIPIFFITTYYTDFILVPAKDRKTVGQALLARGFEFSENDSSYVAPQPMLHIRNSSSISSEPPSTPPPSNIAELQVRTFKQLKTKNVVPFVEKDLHLVQCSGKEVMQEDNTYRFRNGNGNGNGNGNHAKEGRLNHIDHKLYTGLVSALITPPRFLSLTLAESDAPSLLIDRTLLPFFGDSITGDTESNLIPIFLDLVNLPLESTGIVCGVAGRLVDVLGRQEMLGLGHGSGLSYLSTARAGAVVLSEEAAGSALEALLHEEEKTSEARPTKG